MSREVERVFNTGSKIVEMAVCNEEFSEILGTYFDNLMKAIGREGTHRHIRVRYLDELST